MKITEIKMALAATYRMPAAKRRPLFMRGTYGFGKSQCVQQTTVELSEELERAIGFMSLQATIEDPITLSGLPASDPEDVRFAIFKAFRDKLPTEGDGIIVIDELPDAPALVQGGLYEFLLNGKLGSYRLPDGGGEPGRGWYVCATGNPRVRGGMASRLLPGLVSRLRQVSVEPDLQAWMGWALAAGVRPEVIAFLNFRSSHPAEGIPDIFDTFDPTAGSDAAYACGRTYEDASNILDTGYSPAIEDELLRGTIGAGPGVELVAFLQVYRDLVSPDAILLDPTGSAIPSQLSALYAVCGALARKATAGNLDRIVAYIDRLSAEYATLVISQAIRRDPALQHTPAFLRFCHKYGDILAGS